MKILVCGGRDFGNIPTFNYDNPPNQAELEEQHKRQQEYRFINRCLNEFIIRHSIYWNPVGNWLPTDITIISGGATGTDRVAIDFATSSWCLFKIYEADWKRYGKKAGPIRNDKMLKEGKPDVVLAFPGGKGTADMVRRAKNAGVPVHEYTFSHS